MEHVYRPMHAGEGNLARCIQDPNATVGEKHEPGGASSGFFVADR